MSLDSVDTPSIDPLCKNHTKQYFKDRSPIGSVFEGSQTTKLVEIDKVWVLIYNNEEYVRLLDAKSREDAERQVAEMLFLGSANQPAASELEENAPMVKLAPPASTFREIRARRR